MRSFNQDHFLNDLCQQFNENLTPDDNDPNAYFSNFRNLLSHTIEKHATRRPITRREHFSKRKPWITNGFLTSVKTKVRLLKRFVKFKTSESYNKYKQYSSLLNRVIKQSKIRYYHLAINNSRGNSGELWKVIRKLIQSRKSKQSSSTLIENSSSEMQSAKLLNNYVVNIGEYLAKKITVPNINHSHNSQDYCPHSFFLSPTISEEVETIIKTLKIKKATLSGDIDIKFIKLTRPIISPIISDLFNLCVKTGVLPDDMKVAEVIPIYK